MSETLLGLKKKVCVCVYIYIYTVLYRYVASCVIYNKNVFHELGGAYNDLFHLTTFEPSISPDLEAPVSVPSTAPPSPKQIL